MSFRKELRPPAKSFYEREVGQLTRPNRKGWSLGNCPFHNSKSRRSFAVNLDSGAFVCFGCGRKGDQISFLQQRDKVDFKSACQLLGYWEDGEPKQRGQVRSGPLVRYLVMDFVVDGVEHRTQIEDEPKTELQEMRRFAAEAADRLQEIRNGHAETFESEEEVQWAILAHSWELIQKEVADAR